MGTPDVESARVYADFQGLGALRRGARAESPEAARAVATQFEALFVQMMLKSMREASGGHGLFDSPQLQLYRDLFDKQIAIDIAARGDLGVADMLIGQLAPPATAAAADPAEPFSPRLFTGAVVDPAQALLRRLPAAVQAEIDARVDTQVETDARIGIDAAVVADTGFESPADFVRQLLPHAERAGRELGLSPDLLLAQAALETGWGRHIIRDRDGRASHNLFGIKAGGNWDGDSIRVSSLEYEDGIATRRVSPFRAYDSFAESFDDYVEFVRAHPRYQAALRRSADPGAYITALHRAGYATDPDYANKVLGIMRGEIRELKIAEARALTDG
jgi:flagellar protein FlgJ